MSLTAHLSLSMESRSPWRRLAERTAQLQMTIGSILRAHLRGRDRRCRVVAEAGIVPRINAGMNLRVPDLAVTCTPNQAGERAVPDPVLIIEILSPSNEAQTHRNIWAYTTIPSVREILLVRSSEIAAALLRRRSDGSWPERAEELAETAILTLDSIGLSVPLAEFYEDTHLARAGTR